MELDKISPAPNFSAFGFKLKFYETEIPKEKKEHINDLIKISDEIYHLPNIIIKTEEKVDPRFSAKEGKIFIPLNYIENGDNIFSTLKKSLGDKFEEVVILHEMGHAVEVDRKNNIHQIDINSHSDLNYLINNGSSSTNNINYFLIENYKEGFADCYSGLCYYKKYGDISVFDKISEARELRYKEMKETNGDNYVHPNFNIDAPKIFKKTIEELNNQGIDFRNLPFLDKKGLNIEKCIEEASVKGLLKAFVRELETNDAFLSHFKKVGKEFAEEDRGRFKINVYSDVIKEYATKNNLQTKDLVEKLNNEGILPYFMEFQKRSNEDIISNQFIEKLIENKDLKRQVVSGLQIEDVRNFQVEDSIEKKAIINSTEQVKSKIGEIRNKAFSNENNKTVELKNNFNCNKNQTMI